MFTICKNGEYILRLPRNVSKSLQFAVNELKKAFFEVLNAKEQTATSKFRVTADEAFKYIPVIALGDTRYAKKYANTHFAAGGFVIDVCENTVVICGDGDEAVTFGVFTFLEKYFGVKAYAYDETVYQQRDVVQIPDGILYDKPDFSARTLGSVDHMGENNDLKLRLSLNNGGHWIMWAHTHFQLLPPQKYYKEHPDWYAESKSQLCWSSDEMTEELIRNVCARIKKDGLKGRSTHFFMVGHEDCGGFCTCEKCQATNAKYGISGTMMLFVNKVARAVNKYVEENFKGKTVKLVTFGYGPTVKPPVKEVNGKYELLTPEVKAEKNVGVMLAPLDSNWAYRLTDRKHNPRTSLAMLGWNTVGAELFVWTYDSVFDDEFIFIDGYAHLAESYRSFKKLKATYIFDQSRCVNGICFDLLSRYVRSRLMWNVRENTDELIADFCNAYYRAGGVDVKRYIDLVRGRYRKIRCEHEKSEKEFKLLSYVRTQPMYRSEEWWSKKFLEKCLSVFEIAKRKARETNDQEALSRIEAEELSPLYLYLELYADRLETERLKTLVQEFKRIACERKITHYAEHGEAHNNKLTVKYAKWDALIYSEEKYGKELFNNSRP